MGEQPHVPKRNASGPVTNPGPVDEETGWEEERFLQELGLGQAVIAAARARCRKNGTLLEEELLASGDISEAVFYGGIARWLRLPFQPDIDVDLIEDRFDLDLLLRHPYALKLRPPHAPTVTALPPRLEQMAKLSRDIASSQAIRSRLAITTPGAIRRVVWAKGQARRSRQSVAGLFETAPQMSARIPLAGSQGFALGLMLASAVAGSLALPGTMLAFAHMFLSLLYMSTVLFRVWSLISMKGACRPDTGRKPDARPCPVYSVLVALYREAAMVPQLVDVLGTLDWPKSRLDIKLVCEADDEETRNALGQLKLPVYMEVVLVPPCQPRTKPKALAYALPGARGEFLTIYDAEDRPHPGQLKQAYARFSLQGPELACLQAPLTITNGGKTWLSSLFALEYAAQFRCFLPMLARNTLPMPLGGTSNHFRRSALEAAGGWDPHNVTEDADLGLRLYRLGYHADMLDLPTLEEAPESRSIWLGQRSRWYKGWLQTYLVSMRNPLDLLRQLGWRGFAAFQLATVSMVVTALLHPVILLSLGMLACDLYRHALPALASLVGLLAVADMINLFLGYAILPLAGLVLARTSGTRWLYRHLLHIPLYWMMLTVAAWKALAGLIRNPHHWQKTPHVPAGRWAGAAS